LPSSAVLVAKAVAGCRQCLQARFADGLPAGFAAPVGPLFQTSQRGVDVIEVTADLVEQITVARQRLAEALALGT
jgi:hypothetical protein